MNDYKNMPNNSATREHDEARRENRDPISGTPGAHPVGTGLGGASGAVAGAVAGTAVGGPVGTVVGAVVGAVAGGLVGKGVGEAVNPTEEDAYWRGHYHQEAYYEKGRNYDDYAPAYQTGYESRAEHKGQSFEQAEGDLERRYDRSRGTSALAWEQARPATRAAWNRAARGASV
jgi:phage tail tape-measure protein